MGTFRLTKAEAYLLERVEHGDPVELARGQQIRADVLRHIMLDLPLTSLEPGGAETGDPSDKAVAERVCSRTAVGISITGGIIRGRLILDSAGGLESRPMSPLAFQDTRFRGGFSGRHGHFGRLSFRDCRFRNPPGGKAKPPIPTVDLSGATLESDLEMGGVEPFDIRPGGDFLWIRAIGTRIDGNLELSRAHLCAPEDNPRRLLAEHRVQPLDLSLSNIEGDLLFLEGKVKGMISARGAHIRGDVWMSGTRIECRPGDKMALFFQLARIGGGMMLDGRWEFADQEIGSSDPLNKFRSFQADGELNLFGVRVGGSIVMNDIQLQAKGKKGCIDLTGGRVADRIEVGQTKKGQPASINGRIRLDRLEVGSFVSFEDVQLGSEASGAPGCHCIDARSLVAKHVIFRHVVPIDNGPIDSTYNLSITLSDATLERLTIKGERLSGAFEASPLCCTGDVVLVGEIRDEVNLENAKIGGTLDISRLRITGGKARLSLRDATIGGALRLTSRNARPPGGFSLRGEADLRGLSVDTLDDDIGRCWGKKAVIKMDHFTYRRTVSQGREDEFKQSSYRIVADWIQSRFAEIKWPPRWIPKLAKEEQFRRPWQLRRNWIYQQFVSDETRLAAADGFVSITRHRIREHKYSPQPFEQAIRVARAEGREDFATRFEIQKQRLEWRFFNRGVRWPLGFVAIVLSSLWLSSHAPSDWSMGLTLVALAATLGLMVAGSWIRDRICGPLVKFVQERRYAWVLGLGVEIVLLGLWLSHSGGAAWIFGFLAVSVAVIAYVILGAEAAVALSKPRDGGPALSEGERKEKEKEEKNRVRAASSKILTWLVYWVPAILLFAWTDWHEKPFHYFVGFLIFGAIRLMAVFAHAVMRFGFGYLRRPVYAITTLILAFLVGWWGVSLAASRNMFVVATQPSAGLIGRLTIPDEEAAELGRVGQTRQIWAIGSERVTNRGLRGVSCSHEISEALYALDVLIPIVDLGEESRCEIRRFPAHGRKVVHPGDLGPMDLVRSIPDLPLNDNRFWWWMKALYAIAGWIIVSLSILTFAQVNKTHAEPPTEHK